jgi:hypothetical protein
MKILLYLRLQFSLRVLISQRGRDDDDDDVHLSLYVSYTFAVTFMSEKEIKSRNYRDAFISLKEKQNLEIYQDVIVFSEESTANES